MERMSRRPLAESEFLANLALEAQRQKLICKTDTEQHRTFTDAITGLTDQRKKGPLSHCGPDLASRRSLAFRLFLFCLNVPSIVVALQKELAGGGGDDKKKGKKK